MDLKDFWTHPRTKKLDRDRHLSATAMALYAWILSTSRTALSAGDLAKAPIVQAIPASRLLIHCGFLRRDPDDGLIKIVALEPKLDAEVPTPVPKPAKKAPKKRREPKPELSKIRTPDFEPGDAVKPPSDEPSDR